jgi:carboxyl-terminal processing protease
VVHSIQVTAIVRPAPFFAARMLSGQVAYVRLYDFRPHGPSLASDLAQLERALVELSAMAPAGWILDLRNNLGGQGEVLAEVAERFGYEGLLLEFVGRDGQRDSLELGPSGADLRLGRPLAILTNESSASASEILAAAFQDTGRALVFGAGTAGFVNGAIFFEVAGGALELTVARAYAGPQRRYLDGVGLSPARPVSLESTLLLYRHDSQLEAARAYVSSQVLSAAAPGYEIATSTVFSVR